MSSWNSYPKIHNIGHPQIKDLCNGPVVVEEKIDGSQFSFGVFDGELLARSKGQQLILDMPEKMFNMAVAQIREMAPSLVDGWTYRGEYLQKPKHNTLAYDRHPQRHIMLFDIATGLEAYLDADAKKREADRLGLECAPLLFEGEVAGVDQLHGFLERTSVLGGAKIEGVVIKNHARFGVDGKPLMGKHVSEAFRETHAHNWKSENPGNGAIIDLMVEKYRSMARWQKAEIHLREAGVLKEAPEDIAALMREAQRDLREECADEIKEHLWLWAKEKIVRGAVRGLPEWYKEQLASKQFSGG